MCEVMLMVDEILYSNLVISPLGSSAMCWNGWKYYLIDNYVGKASHVQECAFVHHHEVQAVSLSTYYSHKKVIQTLEAGTRCVPTNTVYKQ